MSYDCFINRGNFLTCRSISAQKKEGTRNQGFLGLLQKKEGGKTEAKRLPRG